MCVQIHAGMCRGMLLHLHVYTDITQACYKHTLVHTNRLACTYTLTDIHVHKLSCWHSTQIHRHKFSQHVAVPTYKDILIRHIQGRVRYKKGLFRGHWLLTWKSFQHLPQSLGSSGPRLSHDLCMYVRKGFEGHCMTLVDKLLSSLGLTFLIWKRKWSLSTPHLLYRVVVRINNHQCVVPRTVSGLF